jgi:predicted MFS family arabinose efflux permease
VATAPTSGAGTTRVERLLPKSLQVLRHRDFALVQLGNGISSIGTWFQYVALAWGIHQLTPWPFAVALSLVAQFAPSLVLSPFAGSIADRFDRRHIVIVGNLAMAAPPVAIGVLVGLHAQSVSSLLGLAALGGVAQAIAQPAMTSIVPHIVPESEITQAIAGVSVIQNVTRIVGPSLGALVINQWGLASAFYLNAVSFFAVVLAWWFVRPVTNWTPQRRESFAAQTRAGLRYARHNRQVKHLLILAIVMSAVVFQSALLPVIASNVLHSGAGGFGLLQSAGGPGAIVGAVLAGEIITDRRRRVSLIGGALIMGGGYALVALSRSLWVTAGGVCIFGFSFFMVSAVGQTVLLTVTPDRYRGRVMGLFAMVTVGGVPVAALLGGGLGSWIGPTQAIGVAAIIVFAYAAWFVLSGTYRLIGVEGAAEGEPADDAPARDAQDADAPVDQDAPPVPRPGVAAANLAQRLVHDLAADLDRDVLGTQPTLPEAG